MDGSSAPVTLDPAMFPMAAEYLRNLGGDLSAYPECGIRTAFFDDMAESFPGLLTMDGLPDEVTRTLQSRPERDGWTPTVLVVLLLSLVRDRIHTIDESFLEWNFERHLRLYRRPLFRNVISLLSPTLLFMGASRRWRSFHTCGSLVVTGDKNSAEARLEYPEHLYSKASVVALIASFKAALECSRAQDHDVTLLEHTSTSALYRARWT